MEEWQTFRMEVQLNFMIVILQIISLFRVGYYKLIAMDTMNFIDETEQVILHTLLR